MAVTKVEAFRTSAGEMFLTQSEALRQELRDILGASPDPVEALVKSGSVAVEILAVLAKIVKD